MDQDTQIPLNQDDSNIVSNNQNVVSQNNVQVPPAPQTPNLTPAPSASTSQVPTTPAPDDLSYSNAVGGPSAAEVFPAVKEAPEQSDVIPSQEQTPNLESAPEIFKTPELTSNNVEPNLLSIKKDHTAAVKNLAKEAAEHEYLVDKRSKTSDLHHLKTLDKTTQLADEEEEEFIGHVIQEHGG